MPSQKRFTNRKPMAPFTSLQMVKRKEGKKVCDMEKVDSTVYDEMLTLKN